MSVAWQLQGYERQRVMATRARKAQACCSVPHLASELQDIFTKKCEKCLNANAAAAAALKAMAKRGA